PDVLSLEQVEDGLVVAFGSPQEVQMSVAAKVSLGSHRCRPIDLQFDLMRFPGGDSRRSRLGLELEPLPHLDADYAGGDGDGHITGAVEKPAQIAVRGLIAAVPFGLPIRPFPCERIEREVIFGRLIEIAVRSDDVDPARRRLTAGGVTDDDAQLAG